MATVITAVKDTAIIASNTFSAAMVDSWLDFNRDKSLATVRTYSKAIGHFLKWLAGNNVANPNRKAVIDYRAELCATKRISTARLYTSAVKVFSKWLATNGMYPDFGASVKTPALDEEAETHSRESLTLSEAHAALDTFTGSNEKSLRDALIMRLMLNCGLRSIEIVRLDTTDIEKRHGKIFLRIWGKGRAGKTASVEISETVHRMIRTYLNVRGAKFKPGEPLFVSTANRNKGARLQTQSISRLAKTTFRRIGVDSPLVTCHSCRHTTATLLIKNGVEIEKVQKILRHKSAEVTKIYIHDMKNADNNGTLLLSDLFDKGGH